jgi:hypothetical protein
LLGIAELLGIMPLCSSWNECIPTREEGGAQIQKYTSNTTDPINGILNKCQHDGPVQRDDLENSLMRMGYARGRKQVMGWSSVSI